MPYDITIQVIVAPATHVIADLDKNARRYSIGDPVDVRLSSGWATRTGNVVSCNFDPTIGKFGYIHIIDIPDVIPFEKIKNVLLSPLENIAFVPPRLVRRRKYRVPLEKYAAAPVVQAFMVAHQGTFTFTQAKTYIKKKGVINSQDASTDDETVSITDTDIAS